MKLYCKEELEILLKKTKNAFFAFVFSLCLSLLCIALFIGFAFYEGRLAFELIGSLLSLSFAFLAIYFFDRNRHFRRLANEYLTLLEDKGEEGVYEIKKAKKEPITLSDRSEVYEILAEKEKVKRTVYLSSLFDMPFVEGKRYRLVLAENYVKEYDEAA